MIFEKETIDKQERYLGKKCVHASWRKMGGARMSENVSKDTKGEVYLSPQKCDSLLHKYLANNPEITDFYFPWVEQQVREVGILYNSWGRRYDVRGLRITEDLLRDCYNFYPQAEDADWTNQLGLIPSHHYLKTRYGKTNSLQVHDEIVVSLPLEEIYDYCVFIKKSIERTRIIQGHELWMPAEITVSNTFYGGVEFEQLPEKEEFEKKVKEYLKIT